LWYKAAVVFFANIFRALPVTIQFFGDVYVPSSVTADVAARVQQELDDASFNVVNFEGVATEAFVPLEPKTFLLKMPLSVADKLRDAHISVVTLANNHSMDYGAQGLHDTLRVLDDAGIAHAGAGTNLNEALQPALVGTAGVTACIVAFSRTFPQSFWAKDDQPGTAFARPPAIQAAVKGCKDKGFYTFAVFHWGKEGDSSPTDYQRTLARVAIDAGADGVIGHHPHVIQDIDVYKGKPIFYSLGNFLFGSLPNGAKKPSGLGVRVVVQSLDLGPPPEPTWEIFPLDVNNHRVKFQPRATGDSDAFHPSITRLAASKRCLFSTDARRWQCRFD
jgi:poly-gamma-glutamate synthesis protein (capsule biosynthesis protein)